MVHEVEVVLRLRRGSGYVPDLIRRMKKNRVSQNALAREMGRNPSQVSRWFTPNEERRVTPDLDTVVEIEQALHRLIARGNRQR